MYDFEEINFGYDLIRRENGRVVLPTYGECIDKYSGLFYIEDGLDRFFESAPDYLPTADAQRVLYNTKVLPIRSNPIDPLGDSDIDQISDYDELLVYKSNPLKSGFVLNKEETDFLIRSYNFSSQSYKFSYDNDGITEVTVALGNVIFASNYDYVLLYKQVIMEYISNYYESVDTIKSSNELKEIYRTAKLFRTYLNEVEKSYKKEYIENEMKVISKLNEYCTNLENKLKSHSLSENEISSLYKETAENVKYYSELSRQETQSLPKFNEKVLKGLRVIGDIMTVKTTTDTVFNTLEAYDDLKANKELYDSLIFILEIVKSSSTSVYLDDAASEIITMFESNDVELGFECLKDISEELIEKLGTSYIIGVASSCSLPVLIADLTRITFNFIFNISQKSEYAVYTYGAATMADCFSEYLKNQLYQSFIIGEDYYEVYNNDISKRYFVYLAKLRLYSEDRYCKFRNLYNIEDYSNELLIANYNISFLQDYLSRDYIWW